MFILAIITALILAGGFGYFGVGKLTRMPMMIDAQRHFGMSDTLWQAVGGLEVAGAAGVLIGLISPMPLPFLGVLAAIGLVAMAVGAVITHFRAGDGPQEWAPAVVMGVVAVGYVIFRMASY